MKNKKERKKVLSTKEWICCTMGILFLTLLMVLPPVFRIVFPEDEFISPIPTPIYPNQTNKPEEEDISSMDDSMYDRMVCMKEEEIEVGVKETRRLTFAHKEKELKYYTESIQKVYDLGQVQNETWINAKAMCDTIPQEYESIEGFQYTCTSSENIIATMNKFNLRTFSDTTVTVGGEPQVITVGYYVNQNIDTIKNNLESQNYICQLETVTQEEEPSKESQPELDEATQPVEEAP